MSQQSLEYLHLPIERCYSKFENVPLPILSYARIVGILIDDARLIHKLNKEMIILVAVQTVRKTLWTDVIISIIASLAMKVVIGRRFCTIVTVDDCELIDFF
jgi:hypothetical protein